MKQNATNNDSSNITINVFSWKMVFIIILLVAVCFFAFNKMNESPAPKKDNPISAQSGQVMAPYVINMQAEDARTRLEELGFVISGYSTHFSYDDSDWGLVKEVSIEAGKEYPRGTEVELVVWGQENSGSQAKATATYTVSETRTTIQMVEVPDFVGSYFSDIINSPEAQNFQINRMPQNSVEPAGKIIRQGRKRGSMVKKGSTLNLVVSEGPGLVKMPDVIGMAPENAKPLLISEDFVVEIITVENDGNHLHNAVKSSSLEPGKEYYQGTKVVLEVWD